MATPAASTHAIHLEILTNYIVSMARTVEINIDRALGALLQIGFSEGLNKAPSEFSFWSRALMKWRW